MLAGPCPWWDRMRRRISSPKSTTRSGGHGGRKRTALSSWKALSRKRRGPQSKATWPLGKRRLNVYSLCRSGNPPPAPQSGSEIRRSICSVNGAPRGAIGVFDNRYVCKQSRTNATDNEPDIPLVRSCRPKLSMLRVGSYSGSSETSPFS